MVAIVPSGTWQDPSGILRFEGTGVPVALFALRPERLLAIQTCSRILKAEAGGRVLETLPFTDGERRESALAVILSGGIAYSSVRRAVKSLRLQPVLGPNDSSEVAMENIEAMLGHPINNVRDSAGGWKAALESFVGTGSLGDLLPTLTGRPIGTYRN